MKDLHVIVRDKVATYCERDGKVVCGNKDYQIVFTFDSEWDVYTEKTARFIWGGRHYDVPFTGNTCPMPRVYGATYCLVGVYVDGLETTTPAKIGCLLSVLCAETPPHNEGDKIHADEAKKSADTATNAAQEAKESADRAEEAAKRAEEIADGLEDSGDSTTSTGEIPFFDLVALGLPDVSSDGIIQRLETDTTAMRSALDKGVVKFVISTTSFGITEFVVGKYSVQDISLYLCYYPMANGMLSMVISDGFLQVSVLSGIHLPSVKLEDSGKVLRVVDGAWAAAELSRYLGEHEEVE